MTSRLFWLGSGAATAVLGWAVWAKTTGTGMPGWLLEPSHTLRGAVAVPEIDLAVAASGLALLAGGVLLLLERRRRLRQ
jgi:hypothetical protein